MGDVSLETPWGEAPIVAAQAGAFAARVTSAPGDQQVVATNLAGISPRQKVRGIFFEGLSRMVAAGRGPSAVSALFARAAVSPQITAFRHYPHRDFYKLYYLAARLLHPLVPLPAGIRRIAQTFFPVFRSSLLGRTMTAFISEAPEDILPLVARAYNISVEGNEHHAVVSGPRLVTWRCKVEPVTWYAETFRGIVEGAVPPGTRVEVQLGEARTEQGWARYQFDISW